MAVTDWKSPGTVVSYDSIGFFGWSDPDNAKVNDGTTTAASVELMPPNTVLQSHYLKATNFGFETPVGSTINGIEIQIEERDGGSTGDIYDNRVRIIKSDGSIGTTERAKLDAWEAVTTYTTYGGSEDMWGETWSPTSINDTDFGVALSVAIGANFSAAQVDHIQIRVYYTESAGTPTVGVKYPLPAFKR